MERKIGERFEYDGVALECIESKEICNCNGCFFYVRKGCHDQTCFFKLRSDGKDVIFKEIKK